MVAVKEFTWGEVSAPHFENPVRIAWREAVAEIAAAVQHHASSPAPLPEAPASVNVHLELAGRQVQLTLRDSDEGRLLARLDAILQWFSLVVKPTDTQAPAAEGWCRKHGVQRRQNHCGPPQAHPGGMAGHVALGVQKAAAPPVGL